MKVTSNNKRRPLVSIQEIPEADRDDFDYMPIDEYEDRRLFSYRGSWYDWHEFQAIQDTSTPRFTLLAQGWDGIMYDSAFSAVLVKYFDKEGDPFEDEIIVGYTHW